MARYDGTNIKKKKDTNRSYYNTTIYKKGDRCDNLAFRFYGDVTLWWFIAKVNNLTANNIPAGTSMRIPISTKDAKGF